LDHISNEASRYQRRKNTENSQRHDYLSTGANSTLFRGTSAPVRGVTVDNTGIVGGTRVMSRTHGMCREHGKYRAEPVEHGILALGVRSFRVSRCRICRLRLLPFVRCQCAILFASVTRVLTTVRCLRGSYG